jgi:hypothetical protein
VVIKARTLASGRSGRIGSKIGDWRRQRETALIALSLTILLASVPALSAQMPAGPNVVSGDQNTSLPELIDGPIVCSHASSEFLVGYDSEVAMNAAPQANVVDTMDSILVQYVV